MNITKVVPLVFNGENVWTTKQLAELFDCNTVAIKSCLYYHRKEFIEGVDFFTIKGSTLRRFKNQVLNSKNCNPPFSNSVNSLRLWTKSGKFKLSKYINTDNAKFMYTKHIDPDNTNAMYVNSVFGYSHATNEELNSPLPQLSQLEKLEFLNEFIKNCAIITDSDLRDNLIKQAAKLLF